MAQSTPRERPEIDSYRPAKRPRTDDLYPKDDTNRSYRRRSPPAGAKQRGSTYRPGGARGGWRPRDHWAPDESQQDRQRSASPGRQHSDNTQPQSKSRHSKKERKENPSSKIHSLRRLLSRGGLPATVHREKERELAALLFDQQREAIKQSAKKNLERYHFIRFMERKKAAKTLKRLERRQDQGDGSDDLAAKIHEAEVDLNYTQYAPLGQKYISLFPRKELKFQKGGSRMENLSKMNKRDFAILSQTQKSHLEDDSAEAAGAVELAADMKTVRPPMWLEVEKRMKLGQKALDELRDAQDVTGMVHGDMVVGNGSKKQPDWLDDDGVIDPADVNSDSDQEHGGVALDETEEDEESSDGDGGFFERR